MGLRLLLIKVNNVAKGDLVELVDLTEPVERSEDDLVNVTVVHQVRLLIHGVLEDLEDPSIDRPLIKEGGEVKGLQEKGETEAH